MRREILAECDVVNLTSLSQSHLKIYKLSLDKNPVQIFPRRSIKGVLIVITTLSDEAAKNSIY